MRIEAAGAALACLLGAVAPARCGEAAPAGFSEEFLRSLDLSITDKGWEYARICPATGERDARLLTAEQTQKAAEFLRDKVLPAADRERALALWDGCVCDPALSREPSLLAGLPVSLMADAEGWARELSGAAAAESELYPSFFGPLPVEQAAAGRGYRLAAEGARVLAPGENLLGAHWNAASYLYQEDAGDALVRQNFETQTFALSLRKGVIVFDRALEAGVLVELHRNGGELLDEFIRGVESALAGIGGGGAATNEDRFEERIPAGYRLERRGARAVEHDGKGSGVGDILLTLKGALIGAEPHAATTRLAWRAAANIGSRRAEFDGGNFLGAGLSLEQPLASWLALHADARAVLPLEGEDAAGVPLRPAAFGATVGLEALLCAGTSAGFQIDLNQSPYRSTGLDAMDAPQGSFSLGLTHLLRLGTREILLRVYGAENFVPWPVGMGHDLNYDFLFGLMAEHKF